MSQEELPTAPLGPGEAFDHGLTRPGADEEEDSVAAPDAVGRYRLLRPLGRGGMGAVYLARDDELGRDVAIKLMRSGTGSVATKGRARLRREAQALAQLEHENVVSVYEVGLHAGQVFIAMELVDGVTLRQWLTAAERTWPEIVGIFVQAGRGLAAAHAHAMVHRDFKPSNVMIGADGRVRVLDFGLARASRPGARSGSLAAASAESLGSDSSTDAADELTEMGTVMGTPGYMAPERHRGSDDDPRSDQFSFCVALWFALYGTRPYRNTAVAPRELGPPTGTTQPARPVPGWLRRIVERGLSPDPDDRWPDMNALLAALQRRGRRRRWVAGAAVALGLGAATTWMTIESAPGKCTGGEARATEVWNPSRAVAIEEAFVATQLPSAQSTFRRVADAFETRTAAWAEMHDDACAATHIRHEQSEADLDRRMACLSRRLAELEALVALMETPAPRLVASAASAAAGLPELERCRDQLAATELPADPAAAREVERIQEDLAELRALSLAANVQTAIPLAERLADAAATAGHTPTIVEVGLELGTVYARSGRYEEAERALRATYHQAMSLGDAYSAAAAGTELLFVVGDILGRPDEGLEWGRHTRAALDRAGDEPLLEASLLSNLGAVYYGKGDFSRAAANHERSAQIRANLLGPDDPLVGSSINNLAVALYGQGKYDEARKQNLLAIDIKSKALGRDHPGVATSLTNLGLVAFRQHDYPRSVEHHREALKIRLAAFGPRHGEVGASRLYLGDALREAGQAAEALEQHRQAIDVMAESFGPEHSATVIAHTALGASQRANGDATAAEAELERALAMLTRHDSPYEQAATEFELAATRWDLGQRADAVALAKTARGRLARSEMIFARELEAEIDAWLDGHPAG